MLSQGPIAGQGTSFTDLLLEWIGDPLLLVENGVVIAANRRACELCGRSTETLAGMPMGNAVDLLYQNADVFEHANADTAEVEFHSVDIDSRAYQVAVMRLPAPPAPEESVYRRALEGNFDAFWTTDADGKLLDLSESYATLTGYPAQALRRMTIGEVDPDNAGREISARLPVVRRTGFDRIEVIQKTGAGEFIELEVQLFAIPRSTGRVVGCVRNLTETRASEPGTRRRVQRPPDMVEECIGLARSAPDRKALLEGICDIIVNRGGYAMAWLGAPDPADSRKLRVEAASGKHVEFLDEAQIDIEDTVLAAVPEGEPEAERTAVCNDFESAEFAPWREKAMRYGFASSLSLPVRSSKGVEAALTIYASERDAFGGEGVRALAQVVECLELGLDVVRTRSQRAAMEQHAADWDETFRAAFEHSLYGMVVFDFEGKILDANAEFCSRHGYTRQELLSMQLNEIVAPEFAKTSAERIENIRNDGFAVFETAHVCRDGSVHPIELSCRTYTYGDGEIVLAITRELNEAAQASTRPLDLAVQAAGIGLFDWDLGSNKVTYSNEWKAMLGYTDDQIGDDFGEWELRVHTDDVDKMVADLKAYLNRRGRSYEAEFRMRHKDGSYRWILARGAILYGRRGKPERMLGSHMDTTERRRADQQVWQTRKLEAVSRLAGGLSRDVNQLLTIINGYADLILPRLYPGDPVKEKVQAIRDAGGRAADLTRQLQGFARRDPAALEVANLNAILGGMEETLRRLAGDGVEMVTELSPEMPYLRADPDRIAQLLMGLTSNARDNMAEGGTMSVSVQTVGSLPPHLSDPGSIRGPWVRLTVSDTGAALDEETRLQLFDPFSGANEHDSLRLPEVYGIVKQHGGLITTAAETGGGTQFQVYFPAVDKDAAGTDDHPGETGDVGCGSTVLVVERDRALRGLTSETLKLSGYLVAEAASPDEAVLFAESHPGDVNLLVADLGGPAFTGPKLLEQLRQKRPGLKAVFLSAGPERTPETLMKPFSPADLAKAAGDALATREAES